MGVQALPAGCSPAQCSLSCAGCALPLLPCQPRALFEHEPPALLLPHLHHRMLSTLRPSTKASTTPGPRARARPGPACPPFLSPSHL